MLPAVEQKLSQVFIYLDVRQRVVLCCFTLLAIINAYTMRLCLDFSLTRIVSECDGVKGSHSSGEALLNPKGLPNWRLEMAINLNETKNLLINRLKAGRDQGQPKVSRKRQRDRRKSRRESSTITPIFGSGERISCSELWSRQTQSLVVVAFYAGYMITHVPGGLLAEQYGGKWVLSVSILTSAVFTLLTPVAVRSGGPYVLIGIRLMVGLCEGPCFPAVCALLAQWVPEQERGLLASCVLSGGEIGITMVQLVSGLVMAEQDWPLGFYLVGSGAILWFLGFSLLCYSTPDHCPFIQSEERDYIKSNTSGSLLMITSRGRVVRMATDSGEEEPAREGFQREDTIIINPPAIPWKSMLTSKPLWALVTATMQHDWSKQDLPKELQMVLEKVRSNGLWEEFVAILTVTAPHVGNWLASLTTGQLSDFLIAQQILTRTQTRRLMSWLVLICGSMYMVQLKVQGSQIWHILAKGAYYASVKPLPLDMSPNYAATLTGISGGLGTLPSLLTPYLEQLETDYAVVGSVRAALWIIAASYISGDVQAFNQPEFEPQREDN
ncbi:putative inorganic phosphate cotransporter [Drosophila serrata]|uniref:putative inorganic phosphate cotransporter n=1 Tax=Drosophila serrata TaxID=7274 RepID=UPI000A1D3626|nr:putative inorganic phosphate cotransporter [Drosophila serrata]